MKYFAYVILYILFICRHGHFFKQTEKFHYIKDKFENVTEELKPNLKGTQPRNIQMQLDFFNTTKTQLVNFKNSQIFHLSNKTYFLRGSNISLWINYNTTHLNKSYSLPDMENQVTLIITAKQFVNKNFILTSFINGVSHIYLLGDLEEPLHIQSLKHETELANAKFFINKHFLYLATINTKAAVFYQWHGEHFDQIHVIPTTSTKFETFTHLDLEIMVFFYKTSNECTITLYQFDGYFKKIQFIKASHCYDFKVYYIENKVYMIVLNNENNIIYSWDTMNREFVYHTMFQSLAITEKIITSSIDNINLIFFVSKFGIHTYKVSMNNIHYLTYFKFEERVGFILDVIEEQNRLQIFEKQTDESLSVLDIQYSLHYTEIINSILYEDPLEMCLLSLEEKLNNQLNTCKNKNENILAALKNKNSTRHTSREKFENTSDDVELEPDFDPYELAFIKLNRTTQNVQQEMAAIISKTDEITNNVDKNVLIKGNLQSQRLITNSLNVETINDVDWAPEKWLSYTKDQTITNSVETNVLNSKNVDILNSTFFENLMLNTPEVIVPKLVKINNLKCGHLSTNSINGINFKDIYLKTSNNPVTGLKMFHTIITENLKGKNINYPTCKSEIQSKKFDFSPDFQVKHLNVETVNGINWNEFKQSLFQMGKSRKINGTLTVPNVIIKNVQTNKINGINVKDLLTKTTNQTITSNINFDQVYVKNLNVTKLNGIDFNKDIVLINSANTIIEGPVKMKTLNAFSSNIEDDIITEGKHYDNLRIIGDLRIKNINLSEDAKILLKGKQLDLDISKKYWLKDTNQVIPVDVKISNITVNNLETKTINNVKVDDYMVGENMNNKSTNYYFKHLNVMGNIKLNQSLKHSPNWLELNENVVRKSGGYRISGKKIFNGTIIVKDADIAYLNNIEVDTVPTVKTRDFSGYTFDTIIVRKNLTLKNTIVEAINDTEINKLFDNVKFVDEDLQFKELYLGNVSINQLQVEKNLNNKSLTKYIKEVNKIQDVKVLENVTCEGNVDISFVSNVKSINGMPIKLIEDTVRKGAMMAGNVTFKKDVVIENLFLTHLNDVNIPDLMKRLLYKNWKQSISGYYTFNVVKTNQLAASRINSYNVETLIDITKETPQTIKGNFIFKSVKILGKMHGKLQCNIEDFMALIKNPPMRTWKSVTVTGNITTLNDNNDNTLQEIIDNIVRIDRNNVISGPVTFLSKVHANSIKSNKDINGVNFKNIFDDALRKTEHDQLVTGYKTFSKMTCGGAQVDGNAEIPIVNGIVIKKLNESIISKDRVHDIIIKGHKIFKSGIKINHLETQSLSGLIPENFVNLDDLKPIPKVTFDTLNISEVLTINYVNNNTDFDEFLKDRVLKNFPGEQELSGVYYFDKMELNGNSKITKINDMRIDDIVFDIDQQTILGSKEFIGNLTIYGDVTIDTLNGFNVTQRYQQSILGNKKSVLKGNMTLENTVEIRGNITAKNINGVPIKDIKELINSHDIKKETKQIDDIVKQIENIVHKYDINIADMPQEYMYLERSQKLQIDISNTVSAEIIEGKNHVLLHITGEESGEICGIPKSCNCQNQHVLQLAGDYSYQTLGSKEYERVFSFHSEKILAHLISYTVSYNRICSRKNTNSSGETTTLTWISSNGPHTYIKYNLIDGFITGAKFFTYLDSVYLIITRFYSSSLETHNLDCVIFKFGHKKDTVEMIQKIPTKGAWTLHLFNSHQGLILVIGNNYDSKTVISGTSTDIYVFNEQHSQFVLLRKFIGTGAISIADVVLDKETQIILAQKDSPLIILKYNPAHKNFYIFQNLHLEFEVLSVSKFYLGGSNKDAFLNVVTDNNHFYLYSYNYIEGWRLESYGEIDGIRALVPFNLNGNTHLLAPSTKSSSLLTVQKHG